VNWGIGGFGLVLGVIIDLDPKCKVPKLQVMHTGKTRMGPKTN